MTPRPAGRPRSFDRDDALRRAAHLFWRHGFSGTSTRMLTEALGISSSSMYAAFGAKAELFDEAVRTYALRYSALYDRAIAEPTLTAVIRRLLVDSVLEFTRTDDGHPGCLPSSAVMADSSSTLDVRTYISGLQRSDEARLRARFEQAQSEGELIAPATPTLLAELVQTIWQGLSMRADIGVPRDDLIGAADLALTFISQTIEAHSRPTTPS